MMALPLTPAMLASAYEFLRATPPFNRWKLPPAESVQFKVLKTNRVFGDHTMLDGGVHRIRISEGSVAHTISLLMSMAHEMIHAHLDRRGIKTEHGTEFKRCIAQVCKYHGFDPKAF